MKTATFSHLYVMGLVDEQFLRPKQAEAIKQFLSIVSQQILTV